MDAKKAPPPGSLSSSSSTATSARGSTSRTLHETVQTNVLGRDADDYSLGKQQQHQQQQKPPPPSSSLSSLPYSQSRSNPAATATSTATNTMNTNTNTNHHPTANPATASARSEASDSPATTRYRPISSPPIQNDDASSSASGEQRTGSGSGWWGTGLLFGGAKNAADSNNNHNNKKNNSAASSKKRRSGKARYDGLDQEVPSLSYDPPPPLEPASVASTEDAATEASAEDRVRRDCSYFYRGMEGSANGSGNGSNASITTDTSPLHKTKTHRGSGRTRAAANSMLRRMSVRARLSGRVDGALFMSRYERLNQIHPPTRRRDRERRRRGRGDERCVGIGIAGHRHELFLDEHRGGDPRDRVSDIHDDDIINNRDNIHDDDGDDDESMVDVLMRRERNRDTHPPSSTATSYREHVPSPTNNVVMNPTALADPKRVRSSMFFEQDGRMLMRLPRDQVRLVTDYNLEPGILSVEQWRNKDDAENAARALGTAGGSFRDGTDRRTNRGANHGAGWWHRGNGRAGNRGGDNDIDNDNDEDRARRVARERYAEWKRRRREKDRERRRRRRERRKQNKERRTKRRGQRQQQQQQAANASANGKTEPEERQATSNLDNAARAGYSEETPSEIESSESSDSSESSSSDDTYLEYDLEGQHERHHQHQHETALPELRYVITVPDDLYRRMVGEMSAKAFPPYWGFFKCCNQESEPADIKLALVILAVVMFLLFVGSLEWRTT